MPTTNLAVPSPVPFQAGNSAGDVALSIVHVRKAYGQTLAVEDVSLDLRRGEFLTLLGPSGSGKTTTLMMVAGFVNPSAGQILLEQRDITALPPYERGFGMVFQSYALFPHMSVFDNIAYPLRMRRAAAAEIDERVQRALGMVQLGGYGRRRPGQLSGGQQQRVALARALVFNPPLVLLDEPLGALDRKLRQQMQLEIKHLQQALGTTMVYVTHDQEEALVMSDRVVVMNRGRIEQVGTPDELYERPINRFVADFLGESNFLEGRLECVDGLRGWLRTADGLLVEVSGAGSAQASASVSLALRPERVQFVFGSAPPNCYDAEVREVIYGGENTRYRIQIGAETTLTVKRPNIGGAARLVSGERVRIGWEPSDAIVV